MSKRILFILLACCMLLLMGCWDWQDIESRAYIIGIAIDAYPPLPKDPEGEGGAEEEYVERMETFTGEPAYTMTIQIPIFATAVLGAVEGGSAGGDAPRTWDISQAGNSFIEINRRIATRMSFRPYYEHLKVIVVSEEVAREGMDKIIDFFARDHEIRRRTRVFITPGEAKKILDVTPVIEDYASIYLHQLPTNATATSRMAHATDLGQTLKSIHLKMDFALPRVVATEDELLAGGLAVFKDARFVGWLGELDTISMKIMRNLYLGGTLSTRIPGEDGIAVIEVRRLKTKLTPVVQDDQVRMKVTIDITGDYAETVYTADIHGELKEGYLERVKQGIAQSLERQLRDSMAEIQEKYNADIAHYGKAIHTQRPDLWEEIENDWGVIFPQVESDYEISINLRRIGNIR